MAAITKRLFPGFSTPAYRKIIGYFCFPSVFISYNTFSLYDCRPVPDYSYLCPGIFILLIIVLYLIILTIIIKKGKRFGRTPFHLPDDFFG